VVGDVPPILAQYSNAGVIIVAAVTGSGKAQVLATAAGSGIRTMADLKGKRIGINDGTAQQAVLFRNLRSIGLGIDDIRPVKLGLADFVDALRGGQIDAAVLKQPDRARYLATAATGAIELPSTPEASAHSGNNFLYATVKALNDPAQAAAIRDFVIHWYRAYLWKNTHQESWIEDYLIKDQKLKHGDAVVVADSQGTHTTVPGFTPAFIASQQQTIDILQAAHVFGGKHLDARDEFDPRFAALDEKSPAARD
jgi:sulfonate transport system substrate-binding protein